MRIPCRGVPAIFALALAVIGFCSVHPGLATEVSQPCAASTSVPCSPVVKDDHAAAEASRAPRIRGRILPDEAPPTAEADAARDLDAASVGTALDAQEAASTFTFYNRNSSGKQINFKFFSKTRNWVWPSATSSWISPPDRKQYVVKLACQKGEKVCFGGWWPSQPNRYWGVGPQGNKGCSSCCYLCRGGWAAVNFVR